MSDPANPRRSSQFIEIAVEEDLIAWRFVHPDTKEEWSSVLHVRIVPNALQRTLKNKYTKPEFRRGQKYEDFDWPSFLDDCIDYAVVRWEGVVRQGEELPCTREWKLRLPEMVKTELIRLCIGRELGEVMSGNIGHTAAAGGAGGGGGGGAEVRPIKGSKTT